MLDSLRYQSGTQNQRLEQVLVLEHPALATASGRRWNSLQKINVEVHLLYFFPLGSSSNKKNKSLVCLGGFSISINPKPFNNLAVCYFVFICIALYLIVSHCVLLYRHVQKQTTSRSVRSLAAQSLFIGLSLLCIRSTFPMVHLIQLPTNRVLAHYAQTPQGWAVVTPSGKVLGPSFYAIREQFSFHSVINGAGGWVVLVPCSSLLSQSPVIQPSLF